MVVIVCLSQVALTVHSETASTKAVQDDLAQDAPFVAATVQCPLGVDSQYVLTSLMQALEDRVLQPGENMRKTISCVKGSFRCVPLQKTT